MRPGKQAELDKTQTVDASIDQVEKIKASIRAEAEHPFRPIERQFGVVMIRCRGLAKNAAQLKKMFTLSKLWRARKQLAVLAGQVRPRTAVAT